MSYKFFRLFFVLILVIGSVAIPAPQSVRAAGPWYVSTTGDDNNDCLGPGTPCSTINGAIGKAASGDTINVAVGTYTGSGNEVVLIDKDTTLSGGWDDTFTTQSGMSIIDGEGVRRGTIVNSGTVATMEHFVVQNGFFDGAFNGGGGIRNDGNLTVNNSTISNNLAINCGEGGNIYSTGTLDVNNSTIENGSTVCGGGGLENSGRATLFNSNVKNNFGVSGLDNNGGTVTLVNSTVSGTIGSGLGINSFNSGIINLNDSIVSSNAGVGINIQNGTLTVNNSSVHNNSGGGISIGAGAGTINNSTVSGNGEAPSSTGGIYNGGIINLNSSTIASNTGAHYSVTGGITNFGTITMQNTILAGNTGSVASDCSGTISSAGYNLVGNISGCIFTTSAGDLTNVDAKLGLLIASSAYHPLASNSPAIDAGNPTGCTDQDGNLLTTDQRGAARVGNCDIGAYEYTTPGSPANLLLVDGDNQSTTTTLAFSKPFQVVALDSQGSPVSGVTVVFTAPASGPRGTFEDTGTNTTSVITDEGGVATTSIFTANDQEGTYTVSASAIGLGSVNFNLEQVVRPLNDNFANAKQIGSLPFSDSVDNTQATNELNEPQWCYVSPNTVWYSFTPTTSGAFRVDMAGTSFTDTILNLYQDGGTGISGLSQLQCTTNFGDSGYTTFSVQAGVTYYLQAGSYNGGSGNLQLNLQAIPAPQNDNFSGATVIPSSLPYSDTVDTTSATIQTNEPTPSCAFYGLNSRSVWYSFTSATSGTFSANVPYISFAPVYAVYTGSSIDTLTQISCNYAGNNLTFQAEAGTTYYFQVANLYPWEQGGTMQFHLDVAPPPVAGIYFSPSDPTIFDNIQFYDQSYDPSGLGIQSFAWDFGDGTTSTDAYPTHRYAKEGDYTVQHTVTTIDGRTASTSQTVHVSTHDVTVTKVESPGSARTGQTQDVTVAVNNATSISETVRVDLYRSVIGGGFEWVNSLTLTVPPSKNNRSTQFLFRYTFTAADAQIGKVIFQAVATIEGVRDAFPQDNERYSSLTMVKQKK